MFKDDYKLPRLPGSRRISKRTTDLEIPSEQGIKDKGLNLGDINGLPLQKTEELTLYLIEQGRQVKKQAALINTNEVGLSSNCRRIAAKKMNRSFHEQIDRLAKKR